MTQVSWIATMGYESIIEAVVDTDKRTVTVSPTTLIKMAHDILASGIIGPEEDGEAAKALLATPVNPDGSYTVTDALPWDVWEDAVHTEAPVPPYFDHNGKRTEDPRCELGLCVQCNDDTLARGDGTPVTPNLSVADPRYVRDAEYRIRVNEAFGALGVTYRDDETNPTI